LEKTEIINKAKIKIEREKGRETLKKEAIKIPPMKERQK